MTTGDLTATVELCMQRGGLAKVEYFVTIDLLLHLKPGSATIAYFMALNMMVAGQFRMNLNGLTLAISV
jgi:hypothetical protein